MNNKTFLTAIRGLFVPIALAVFGAFAPVAAADLAPLPDAMKPNRLFAVALHVADIERSKTFYMDVLGLKVANRIPASGEVREYMLSLSGGMTGEMVLVLTKVPQMTPGSAAFGRLVLIVPDAAALAKRAADAGSASDPAHPKAIRDPDGNMIELFQPPPKAAAPDAPAQH